MSGKNKGERLGGGGGGGGGEGRNYAKRQDITYAHNFWKEQSPL